MVADISHEQKHRDRTQGPVRDEIIGDRGKDAPHRPDADNLVDPDQANDGQRDADGDAQDQQDDDRREACEGETEIAHCSTPGSSASIT